MDTPDWLKAFINAHGGGWFHPMAMSPDHPIVVEGWCCFACSEPILATEVVMVMPFHGEDEARWTATHRECSARQILPPAMRAKLRPPDFKSLTPEQQWQVDKRLGILDWDGSPDAEDC